MVELLHHYHQALLVLIAKKKLPRSLLLLRLCLRLSLRRHLRHLRNIKMQLAIREQVVEEDGVLANIKLTAAEDNGYL